MGGYVVTFDSPVVRVIVPEDSADLVRRRSRAVELRLVDRMDETYPATIQREVPAISDQLPSLALSTLGGGAIHMDPRDPQNIIALEKLLQLAVDFAARDVFFDFDLSLDSGLIPDYPSVGDTTPHRQKSPAE